MRDPDRPKITSQMLDRFYAYYLTTGGSWKACHVCLADGNYDMVDNPEWARENGDEEGAQLCEILETLTPTQRGKIAKRCRERQQKERRDAAMATDQPA